MFPKRNSSCWKIMSSLVPWTECLYVPPEFICWNLTLGMIAGDEGFGRWSDCESRAFMTRIRALIKEAPWRSLIHSTRWGTQWEGAIAIPESRSSPDTKSVSTFILDFQPPELWKISVVINYLVYGISF